MCFLDHPGAEVHGDNLTARGDPFGYAVGIVTEAAPGLQHCQSGPELQQFVASALVFDIVGQRIEEGEAGEIFIPALYLIDVAKTCCEIFGHENTL